MGVLRLLADDANTGVRHLLIGRNDVTCRARLPALLFAAAGATARLIAVAGHR